LIRPAFYVSARQRLNTLHRNLSLWLHAGDRLRRRNRARLEMRPITAAASESVALAQLGCTPWQLDPEAVRELLQAWRDIESVPAGRVERSTGKLFFKESLSLDDLKAKRIFVDIALDERLLHLIMAEIGLLPHLESVEVVVSHPTSGALTASQLWHRDVNDRRLLKLFVYLEDVAQPQGPFTYVPVAASARVPRLRDHYLADAAITATVPASEWVSIRGTSGTSFVIDTGRCYHCGSRCSTRRVAYIATYSCGIKYMKYADRWAEILRDRVASLTPLQRAVCDLAR
jgi:hypothetical protein